MPGPGQGTGLVSQMSQAWARAAESHSGRRNAGETEACVRTSKTLKVGRTFPSQDIRQKLQKVSTGPGNVANMRGPEMMFWGCTWN